MFNQAAFNQTAYNRPSGGPIVIAVQLSSSSTAFVRLICAVPLAAHLDGVSSSTQNLITPVSAVLSATSSLTHIDSARAYIASIGSVVATCWLVMHNAANLGASSEFNPQAIRTVPIGYAGDGFSDVDFNSVRARIQDAALRSPSELHVLGKVTHRIILQFLGSINPNDVVEIDTERMTVTVNGQNALHLVDGRFWELITGRNTIRYADSEPSRQVALTITFRDRWL